MKIFLIGFIFLLLFCSNSFTQIDTTSLAYYPLNDGDYWEYYVNVEDWIYPPAGYIAYYSYEVIGDSSFSIEKTYKTIEITKLDSTQQKSYIFERIDRTTCNVYRYDTYDSLEFLIDSLKSQTGDSCNARRTQFHLGSTGTICTNIVTDTILSQVTISKIFEEQHWHAPIDYKLSEGFGLTYLNYYFDICTFTQQLLYARIDDIEYGTQVNSIPNENDPVLNNFHLYQNYPNPFNSTTIIPFVLPQRSKVEIIVYDITGRKLKILVSHVMNQGSHNTTWDGTNYRGQAVVSGVYIYSLIVSELNKSNVKFFESKKLLLLR